MVYNKNEQKMVWRVGLCATACAQTFVKPNSIDATPKFAERPKLLKPQYIEHKQTLPPVLLLCCIHAKNWRAETAEATAAASTSAAAAAKQQRLDVWWPKQSRNSSTKMLINDFCFSSCLPATCGLVTLGLRHFGLIHFRLLQRVLHHKRT